MSIKLENINPKFRELTDLLFYSNNTNLDLEEYINLLKLNYNIHLEYFTEVFIRSCYISWENNKELWEYRLNFIFSIKEKAINNRVVSFIEKRMSSLTRLKFNISPKYDNEFLQYLVLCSVKKSRKENLNFAYNFLEELPSYFKIENIIDVISFFIPILYNNLNSYAENLSKKISNSTKNFFALKEFKKHGINCDKKWLINIADSIIIERVSSDKNRRLFFALLADPDILDGLKEKYSSLHKTKILTFLNQCDYILLEGPHLINIKNIIALDNSLVEPLTHIYINKIYGNKLTFHKRSSAHKLIKLLKKIEQITPRPLLSYLSSKNKMSDVKYILNYFPEVKNLSAFF